MKQLLTWLALLLAGSQLAAQQQEPLVKGKTIRAIIRTKEKHGYTLRLVRDQFIFLKVMQLGADVKVTTFDPKGGQIAETDSPNGTSGPEYVTLHTSQTGNYRIEIEALGVSGPGASYELTLPLIRPKAVTLVQQIDELFVAWSDSNSPGACVAVLQGGKILYQKGYGMANLENQVPNRVTTRFHVASLTKTFTSYGVLALEKQGKLCLEDDIRQYVPEVPDFGHPIRIRHLLQHTSGLRTYESLHAMSGYDIHREAPFLKLISRQRDLNFLPGADYEYSNTGFVLLASVIERVSGKSYPAFVKETIFDPLHMTSAVYQDQAGKVIADAADSYEPGPTGPRKLYVVNELLGSTGLVMTASDLARWGAHLLNPGSAADIVQKMRTPGKLMDGKSTENGLGLALADHKGHKEIGHSGAEGGFKAHMSVFPDDDLVVVVLANASDIYARPVARQIADFYVRPIQKSNDWAPSAQATEASKPTQAIPFDRDKVDLSQFTGTYYSDELETIYRVGMINGRLIAQHSFLPNIDLSPTSQDMFIMEGWNGKAEFVRDSQQAIRGCKFSYHRMRNLYFRKISNL